MPVMAEWDSILPYVNQLKDLNWYGVKVAGLAAGNTAFPSTAWSREAFRGGTGRRREPGQPPGRPRV